MSEITHKRQERRIVLANDMLSGVPYRGKIATVRLYDHVTKPMNLPRLSEFYEEQKKEGNPVPADIEIFGAYCETALKIKDVKVRDPLVQRIRSTLRNNAWTNFMTGISWNPSGKGVAYHNKGTSDEYTRKGKFIGEGGPVLETDSSSLLRATFGHDSPKRADKMAQGINGTHLHQWRVNSLPDETIETAVRLDAGSGSLGLGAGGGPLNGFPALLVEIVDLK